MGSAWAGLHSLSTKKWPAAQQRPFYAFDVKSHPCKSLGRFLARMRWVNVYKIDVFRFTILNIKVVSPN